MSVVAPMNRVPAVGLMEAVYERSAWPHEQEL